MIYKIRYIFFGLLISDSYTIATNYIAEKLDFDFSESNTLGIRSNWKVDRQR
jgi:phosphoserine phosphatase